MGKYMGKCMSKTCIYLFDFLRMVGNAVKKQMADVDKFRGGGVVKTHTTNVFLYKLTQVNTSPMRENGECL